MVSPESKTKKQARHREAPHGIVDRDGSPAVRLALESWMACPEAGSDGPDNRCAQWGQPVARAPASGGPLLEFGLRGEFLTADDRARIKNSAEELTQILSGPGSSFSGSKNGTRRSHREHPQSGPVRRDRSSIAWGNSSKLSGKKLVPELRGLPQGSGNPDISVGHGSSRSSLKLKPVRCLMSPQDLVRIRSVAVSNPVDPILLQWHRIHVAVVLSSVLEQE